MHVMCHSSIKRKLFELTLTVANLYVQDSTSRSAMARKEGTASRTRSPRGKQYTLCFGEGRREVGENFKRVRDLQNHLHLKNPGLLKILLKELERLVVSPNYELRAFQHVEL